MAQLSDGSVGIAIETTYGTPVTVARFLEFLGSSKIDYTPNRKQGMGLRVGSKVARSGRRVTPTFSYTGNLDVELTSKGLGLLFQLAMGDSTSTMVAGALYQQVHSLESTVSQPCATLQYVPIDASGGTNPVTLTGVTVPSFEIDCPNGDIVTGKFAIDAQTASTATSYATPSYAAGASLFHFAEGAITIGGTVVAPTTTALASGGTAVANIRDFNLKVDSATAVDRFNLGSAGKKAQPTVGLRAVSGSFTAEYTANTLRDAYLADTPLALTLMFDTGVVVGAGTEKLQIVIPELKLDSELPAINGTDLITQSVNFTVLDNLTAAQPLWIVQTTADTAL